MNSITNYIFALQFGNLEKHYKFIIYHRFDTRILVECKYGPLLKSIIQNIIIKLEPK